MAIDDYLTKSCKNFKEGYRLTLDNIRWGSGLPAEKRTPEQLELWQHIQELRLSQFNYRSVAAKLGGWVCIARHLPTAYRMHRATCQMSKYR